MEKWPVGVFVSIDAGLGVQLNVARELGIKTVQVHTPRKESRTPEKAAAFLQELRNDGMTISTVFLGFEGESYATIQTTAQTIGFVPESTRALRVAETKEISDFVTQLECQALGCHIGFVPHDRTGINYQTLVSTIQEICDYLANNGQTLHLETGQETAEGLLTFIDDIGRPNLFMEWAILLNLLKRSVVSSVEFIVKTLLPQTERQGLIGGKRFLLVKE